MRIAVCSLSEYTHVSEILDAACALNGEHELRYYTGYRTEAASNLLHDHRIDHACTFGQGQDRSQLKDTGNAENTDRVFLDYFFKHAELALPGLIEKFRNWRPDLIFSHLRDYAGSTAAEYFGSPLVTFGSHQSPWRIEPVDPPFGAGRRKTESRRRLEVAWHYHRQFNKRVDEVFNSTIRRPLGLGEVKSVSTFHSRRLTLLSLPAFMSNKNSAEPPHVRFVGPQFTQRACKPDQHELLLLSRITDSKRPRVLLALGTTYNRTLLPGLLTRLQNFQGTIVVAGEIHGVQKSPAGTISGFFCAMDSLYGLCDVVITTGAGKSATDALRHGKAMLCVPCQGEQKENALSLESLGVAMVTKISQPGGQSLVNQLKQLIENPAYRQAAGRLRCQMRAYSGVCAGLITELMQSIPASGAR